MQLAALSSAPRSNSSDAVTAAATHGMGIVMLPDLLATDLVRQGRLQPVLPGWQAPPIGIYLAYGSRHQPLRVRKLLDHLLEAIPAMTGQRTPVTMPSETVSMLNRWGAVRHDGAVAAFGQRA